MGKPSIASSTVQFLEELERNAVQKAISNKIFLDEEDVAQLKKLFTFSTGKQLAQKIVSLGTIKVQGREFFLRDDQIKRLKQSAFFMVKKGEPRTEGEAGPELTEKIVNRYLDEVLTQAIAQMTGEI